MKVLHLEASSGWGGQEIRVLREAEGIRSRDHEVLFGVAQGGKLHQAACKAGFTCYPLHFNKLHWPFCLIQLMLIVRRHKIDLINTHSSLDAWIGGIAARITRRSVIRTRHLSTSIKPGWNSKILYGMLSDFTVTTCSSVISMICSQSGKNPAKCRSIPTGIDPLHVQYCENTAQKIREDFGATKKDLLVGTVCVLRSWKGIPDFLKAADQLRQHTDIKWVVIGGGHEATYRQMAGEMDLEELVHFTGHLDNPFHAMGALDVFTLLSTANEGVSQAILQAAYLGKPLVATPTGGLGEVCLQDITGIQVAPFAPNQVAEAILTLKGDAALRNRLGQNGKRLVEEQFTFKKTIDQMEKVYAETVFRS